ncbi:hypothetical protein NDU88_005262 [Pleurodeles waltl]|uniref:Uncharacterized protein n=1 Tax=Pleurodeles waltl TaxID=8319 RepID=A0AAV7NR10_PLEWA|nr:hypothetical protein NDU88_005262 [Pleurodeles waltl]
MAPLCSELMSVPHSGKFDQDVCTSGYGCPYQRSPTAMKSGPKSACPPLQRADECPVQREVRQRFMDLRVRVSVLVTLCHNEVWAQECMAPT